MKKNKGFIDAYVGPRNDVLNLVPPGAKSVLDIGCSTGVLGLAIKVKTQAQVVGVDLNTEMAKAAAKRIDKIIIGDVENPETIKKLKNMKFDTIIFADVLEHMQNPWTTLAKLVKHLEHDGHVIASIPNVGHLDTLYNLIVKSYWPYRERGIHDKTHLRFFTLKNIYDLFESAGLTIEKVSVNYRIIETPHFLNNYAKFFAFPGLRNFLAFQYLILARKK